MKFFLFILVLITSIIGYAHYATKSGLIFECTNHPGIKIGAAIGIDTNRLCECMVSEGMASASWENRIKYAYNNEGNIDTVIPKEAGDNAFKVCKAKIYPNK